MRQGKRPLHRAWTAYLAIIALIFVGGWALVAVNVGGPRPQDIWKAYPLDSSEEGQPSAPRAAQEGAPASRAGDPADRSGSSSSLPPVLVGILLAAAAGALAVAVTVGWRRSSSTDASESVDVATCELSRSADGSRCQFRAVIRGSDDSVATVAESPAFEWPPDLPFEPAGVARDAHQDLLRTLRARGWEADATGPSWYEQRFHRPSHTGPSQVTS
jgi:hypothetical protein